MGYVKTYRNSKNLFDKSSTDVYENTNILIPEERWIKYEGIGKTIRIPVNSLATYSISFDSSIPLTIFKIILISTENVPVLGTDVLGKIVVSSSNTNAATFSTLSNTKYIVMQLNASLFDEAINSLMLVPGSVPYNYEAYNVTAWYDFCKGKTADGWTDGTPQKAPF